jgi:superfamily II DNA or RNA helicase
VTAVQAIQRDWQAGTQRTLLVLPTGCGKTIVFSHVAADAVRAGKRVLILAHRGELLQQAADKLRAATGLGCAVEKAEDTCLGGDAQWFRVVVGSVQSLMQQRRLAEFPRDHFGTIIIDEAHHALSSSYQTVLDHFNGADVLGVTATPDRGDLRNLGEYFDNIAYEYHLPEAIKAGHLAKIQALTVPIRIDLRGCPQSGGDVSAKSVGHALDPYLQQIAREMRQHCANRRKIVVFLPLIATSQKMRDALNAEGFRAAEVNGGSTDREEVLYDFQHTDRYNVLCNSMLLTEGWDCPEVDCIVPLRATKIRSLYCQMIGRGTRPAAGKENLLILDLLWHTDRIELCQPAYLVAESAEVAQQMAQNIEEAGGPVDLEEAEQQAESDCVEKREQALADKLHKLKRKKQRLVDPLQYAFSIGSLETVEFQPSTKEQESPTTTNQRAALEGAGINPDAVETRGQAEALLNAVADRNAAGKTTAKQIRLLERYGFQHVGQWDFSQAKTMIDRIAARGWRKPYDINPETYQP